MKKFYKYFIVIFVLAIIIIFSSGKIISSIVQKQKESFTKKTTLTQGINGVDFVLDFYDQEEITILQITDTQLQDYNGARNEMRELQIREAFFSGNISKDHKVRVWQYVDEAVKEARPDLIVATGDNIYGELDDDGEMWIEFIEQLDSYEIPWLVIFGNHDNESGKGVSWQVEQLINAKYCVFSQGDVTGNSNYNVLIKTKGVAKYLFYMLDTNGSTIHPDNPGEGLMPDNVDIDKIQQTIGVADDQVQWLKESAAEALNYYGKVPVLCFMHVAPKEVTDAIVTKYPETYDKIPFYAINEGDLGQAYETIGGIYHPLIWSTLKEIGCVGIFLGHQHLVATSILYDGIRITYGLKTGTYDYHSHDMIGSTKITLPKEGSLLIEYLHSNIDYDSIFEDEK